MEVFVLHARHACAWRSRLDRPCGHDVGGPPNAANDTAVPIPTEAIYRAQHLSAPAQEAAPSALRFGTATTI